MQSTARVITEAKDVRLIDTYAARIALNMTTSSDFTDKQIELLVNWASGEIAAYCRRVFARETLEETFRDLDSDAARIFLSHYPVSTIESVIENDITLVEETDYELDTGTGRLTRLGGTWVEPVTITYTGGYNLPFEAPLALQQAALLMTREAYYAATRGDATTRMVAHKESRIIYFDPNARGGAAGQSGNIGSPARRAVNDLLTRYMRFPC